MPFFEEDKTVKHIPINYACMNKNLSSEILSYVTSEYLKFINSLKEYLKINSILEEVPQKYFFHHLVKWKYVPLDIIMQVLDAEPDACAQEDTNKAFPLHLACTNPDLSMDMLTVLLDKYPEGCEKKTDDGRYPLHFICSNKNATVEIVSKLVEHYQAAGMQQDGKNRTPLHIACESESPKVMYLLGMYLDACKVEDADGAFPLHLLCINLDASIDIVSAVISKFPEAVNHKSERGTGF